jgi:cytochrome P450
LLGNLGLLQRDILTLLEELPRQYGDIVRLRFAGYRAVLLSHPDAVEQVLVTQGKKFEKPPRFRRIVRPAFGNGLFANQGDAWTQQRRRMQTALDGIDLDSHCQTVVQCTQQNLAQWRDDEDRDLVDLLVDLALAARAKTSLGLDRTDAFRCIHAALGRFMGASWNTTPTAFARPSPRLCGCRPASTATCVRRSNSGGRPSMRRCAGPRRMNCRKTIS